MGGVAGCCGPPADYQSRTLPGRLPSQVGDVAPPVDARVSIRAAEQRRSQLGMPCILVPHIAYPHLPI